MHLSEIPQTQVLGVTASSGIAAQLLNLVLAPGALFTHYDIIHGAARSGRILFQRAHPGTVQLPQPLTSIAAMAEFEKMKHEARYLGNGRGQRKGWSVGKCTIGGALVAVVWCEWAP
jgi:hypothetical protein